jgi:predicted dehydrogenase
MAYHHLLSTSDAATWPQDEAKGGGIVVDTLTHGIDLFNWYFGSPSRVGCEITASGSHDAKDRISKCDNAVVMARYDNGLICSFRVSWIAPFTIPKAITEVLGTQGAFRIEAPSRTGDYFRLVLYKDRETTTFESAGKGHFEKAKYFIDVVRGAVPLVQSRPEDGKEALRVALAAWSAAKTGTLVEL